MNKIAKNSGTVFITLSLVGIAAGQFPSADFQRRVRKMRAEHKRQADEMKARHRRLAAERKANSERSGRKLPRTQLRKRTQLTERNREQLLGRHLMQRRALYARCLRGDDLRTALIVLKDEAALEGLYPPTKIAPTTPDGRQLWPETTPEDRRKRAVRLLEAEERDDEFEQLLLENKTPRLVYRFPDTLFPILFLHVMTLMYVVEQLEHTGQFLHAEWRRLDHGDPDGRWNLAAQASAYRFKIGLEG